MHRVIHRVAGGIRRLPRAGILQLAFLLALALMLSVPGITDERTADFNRDMPRYLMDGVFVRDFVVNRPWSNPVEFATLYFARYPALGLGHYPPLPALVESVGYALFGVSVFTARVVTVAFTLLLTASTFLLARAVYGPLAAFLGTALLVTNPFVVDLSRVVTSEVPALALVVLSFYRLQQFVAQPTRLNWSGFLLVVAASAYGKHTSTLLFPVYVVYLWQNRRHLPPWRSLLGPLLVAFVLFAPFALWTVVGAWMKIRLVFAVTIPRSVTFAYYVKAMWLHHLVWPLATLAMCAVAVVVAVARRDYRPTLFVLWVVVYYLGISMAASALEPRYAVYWIPALCILAGSAVTLSRRWRWRMPVLSLLGAVIAYQLALSVTAQPPRAEGYEEAARLVVHGRVGATVLYSHSVDTGLFVFFVRKNDPDRGLVVLRADKLLETSDFDHEDRAVFTERIHELLRGFGTEHVVIEGHPEADRSACWTK